VSAMSETVESGTQAQRDGQIQVGRLLLQLGSPYGARLSPVVGGPAPRPREGPILLRPRPIPDLVGRSAALDALRDAVHGGRVAVLYGAPGMGKTALLTQLAYQVPRSWCPDGTIYLSARHAQLSDVLQTLYDLLYEVAPPQKTLRGELVAALQKHRLLLLLDDVSLSREDCLALVRFLPEWRLVLASTQPLALDDAFMCPLDGLSPDDALTLVERQLGQWVSSADKSIVQQACLALQGNPLLVLQMLALARKRDVPLRELIADLSLDRAPQALQEQILASLTEPERRVLTALASVDGVPLSVPALVAATDLPQPEPILQGLRDQYLIDGHESIQVAGGLLAAFVRQSFDTTPWLWRVLSDVLATYEQSPVSPSVDDEASRTVPRLCACAAQAGWWPEVVRLARATEGSLVLGRRWAAWEAVLHEALRASRAIPDQSSEAWALHQLGVMAICLGDDRRGHALLKHALRLQRRDPARALAKENLAYRAANVGANVATASAQQRASSLPKEGGLFSGRAAGSPALGRPAWRLLGVLALLGLIMAFWGLRSLRPGRREAAPLPSPTLGLIAAVSTARPSSTAAELPTLQPTTAIPSPTTTPSPLPSMTPLPTALPATVYDLLASASRARWRNSVQQVLSFPSRGSASLGLVRPFTDALEDGAYASAGLETRPNLVRHGFIRGYYRSAITIQPGDRFHARLGFSQGAEEAQVTFRMSFDTGCNGTYDARWELRKAYDGHLATWVIPLDPLFSHGETAVKGCVALQVDAGDSARNDRAVWVEARIERP